MVVTLAILCLVLVEGQVQLAGADTLPPIWFSPRTSPKAAVDLMDLFNKNAPWQEVVSRVSVFEVPNSAVRDQPDIKLSSIVAYLQEKHIKIQFGMGALSGSALCGNGVEGYNAPGQPLSDARRMKALGATVAYFAMDEPLFYGHYYGGRNACHSGISELVRDVATKVRAVQAVYPDARVGDVEPVYDQTNASDLKRWFDEIEVATGQKLAFFRADIQWHRSWQAKMDEVRGLLAREGIPLQVIYNGDGDTDQAWADSAVQNFKKYESSGRPPPDAVVFECWTRNPTHMLPEQDPTTLTGIMLRYFAWESSR